MEVSMCGIKWQLAQTQISVGKRVPYLNQIFGRNHSTLLRLMVKVVHRVMVATEPGRQQWNGTEDFGAHDGHFPERRLE